MYLEDTTAEERQRILSLAIEQVFNTGKSDILKSEAGVWYFQGRKLAPQQVNALRAEAEAIQNMRLYQVLDTDTRYQGTKKMNEAITLPQLESAKLLIWIADIWKTRLNQLSSLPQLPEA